MINPTKEAKNNKFLVTKIHFVNMGEYGFQGSTDENRSPLNQVVRSAGIRNKCHRGHQHNVGEKTNLVVGMVRPQRIQKP